MDVARDLARIAQQEEQLRFERFGAEDAWQIGSALRSAAIARECSVAIDVTLNGALLFYSVLPGATPNNGDWIRRKKNVMERFHRSTYALSLEYAESESTLEARTGAPLADYVTAGGCFPIRVRGSEAVLGSITVSGLPEREDHELVVRCVAQHLGLDPASVALPA